MAEQIKREYEDIVRELFAGKDSAMGKLAKVRRTQYEMSLWRDYGYPLYAIAPGYVRYFSERFLGGVRCEEASRDKLAEAFQRLNYAVGTNTSGYTGCYARCTKLVSELNVALKADGLRTVDPKGFIKWMTFSYTVPLDYLGNPVIEKPYGFEVRNFHNDEDRADFWRELQKIMREKRRMSMQGVLTILNIKRRESVKGA